MENKTLHVETPTNKVEQHAFLEIHGVSLLVGPDLVAPHTKIIKASFYLDKSNTERLNELLNKAGWHQKNTLVGRSFTLCLDDKVIGDCNLTARDFNEQSSALYYFQCNFGEVDNYLF